MAKPLWMRVFVCSLSLVMLCVCQGPVGANDGPAASVRATATSYLPLVTAPVEEPGLIQPDDLHYLGAFRLPESPHPPDNVGWEWGGTALTYYPQGDPLGPADGFPGSLFGAGHDQTQYVSEINIPEPVLSPSKDLAELNTASTLQPFTNIREHLYDGIIDEWAILRSGLAYLPRQGAQGADKLYFCWAAHAPGNDTDTGPTHGWRDLTLGGSASRGIWRVGGYPKYVTADYMFDIATDWADSYVAGRYLATGRFRDGGQAAEGPSLLAIAPWQDGSPPTPGQTLDAVPLLLYQNVLAEEPQAMNDYHHSDAWEGGAWLTVGHRSAVVFAGTKGLGDCWYGCADGTVWPDEPPYPPECAERGWWSTGFQGQLLFYDPNDLAEVAQGLQESWEPQPYAVLDLDPVLYNVTSMQQKHHVGAIAYDRTHHLLYLMEPLVDEDRPIVHVWSLAQTMTGVLLGTGWNLISLPAVPDETRLPQALASIDGAYDQITYYDNQSPVDRWRHNGPALPDYARTLDEIDETMGLWVHCTQPVTLTVSGAPASGNVTVPISAGWNLVGYPTQTTRPVSLALTSIAGQYQKVCAYDRDSGGIWLTHTSTGPTAENTLNEMSPGRGYWIEATVAGLWYVLGD